MANYTQLIRIINDNIKANGNQEITGPVLNAVLQVIVKELSKGALFAGIANTTTNPPAYDGNVFYIAVEPGTYSNFGAIEISSSGIYILSNASGSWTLRAVMSIDSELSGESRNPVENRVVTEAISSNNKDVKEYVDGELEDGIFSNPPSGVISIGSEYSGRTQAPKGYSRLKLPVYAGAIITLKNQNLNHNFPIYVLTDYSNKVLDVVYYSSSEDNYALHPHSLEVKSDGFLYINNINTNAGVVLVDREPKINSSMLTEISGYQDISDDSDTEIENGDDLNMALAKLSKKVESGQSTTLSYKTDVFIKNTVYGDLNIEEGQIFKGETRGLNLYECLSSKIFAGDELILSNYQLHPNFPSYIITDNEGVIKQVHYYKQGDQRYYKNPLTINVEQDGYFYVNNWTNLPSPYDQNPIYQIKRSTSNQTKQEIIDYINSLQEGYGYETKFPEVVFGIGSKAFYGRQYLTDIIADSLVKDSIQGLMINGNKWFGINNIETLGEESRFGLVGMTTKITETDYTLKLSAVGYETKEFPLKYIKLRQDAAQNKTINVLVIGDSQTDAKLYDEHGERKGAWNWTSFMTQLSLMDNKDVGGIKVNLLGTRNNLKTTFTYKEEEFTLNSYNEGRSGWSAFGYLHHNIYTNFNIIGFDGLWYWLGLATKTPYDSETPGQSFEAFGSYSKGKETIMRKTNVGRYKIDLGNNPTEYAEIDKLWQKLIANFDDFTGTGVYSGTSEQKQLLQQYWEDKLDNPDNPFYSKTKAQAYSGNYEWTNENAFSITEYLNRYRTLDDSGNRLLDNSPEKGTKVLDVNAWDVCKPTHVFWVLGGNDGSAYQDDIDIVKSGPSIIREELPDAFIASFAYRLPGVIAPNEWQCVGILQEGGNGRYNNNLKFSEDYGDFESQKSNKSYWLPIYYVQGVGSSRTRGIYDFVGSKDKIVANNDTDHLGLSANKSVGYQCLAWIYYTALL